MIRASLLFILSINSILLCGKQIEVCPECPIKSMNEGVRQAQPGDEIIILKGVYIENDIEIDKPLTITGIDYPVIDGTGAGHIIKVLADSVHISGLKLINVGQSYTKDYAAIYLSRVNQFEIHDMILEKVFFGMLIEKSHYGKIYNNRISGEAEDEAGAGNGIHLWHCSNAEIYGNEIFEVRDGIYFEFVSDSHIRDNYSHDNIRYGLHFMFSNNDEYHYNTFVRNGAGVAVMFSKFIKMTHNKFYKNWGTASYGLLLKEIYDAEIEKNVFEENTIGINLEGSTRINYKGNNFIRNGWAIKIAGACYTNIFDGNNFLHNSFDVSYNSKLNDNLFENNYWSAYTGYDLDKDGSGRCPFPPGQSFFICCE